MESHAQNISSNDEIPSANGWFQIAVPNDGLTASVKKIVRHTGNGKPVKANDILKKLKQLKVTYGIDREAIEDLVKSVDDNNVPEEPVVIAKGDVENGKNGSIEWCIEGITEKDSEFLVTPKVKIAVRTLASQGKKGKNVYGKPKNPRPGFDQQLNNGDGVVYSQETDDVLIYESTRTGMLRYKSGTLSIDSGLDISEDKLQVHMDIYAGKVTGLEKEVTETDILDTLETAGIKYGINSDQIKSTLEKAQQSGGVVNNVLVAEGKAPVNGNDGIIEWSLDVQSEDINKRAVLPGQTIATLKSNSESSPGIDVFEEVIPGIDGAIMSLKCGEGVEITNINGCGEYKSLWLGVAQYDSDTLIVKSGIKVSDDKLKVTMSLLRPDIATDEGNILLPHVITTLNEHGIVYGIKIDAIKLILESINKERKSRIDLLVAEGKAPVNGDEGIIEWSLDVQSEDINKRAVLPGQTIATIKSNTESKPGVDVFEEVMPGIDGTETSLTCGEGVEKIKVNECDEYKALWLGVVQSDSDTLTVKSGINVSDDKLKVTMSLLRPDIATDKGNILFKHVTKTLNEHGIIYGIKNDAIKLILENINKQRKSRIDLLVAEGTAPVNGDDDVIDWRLDVQSEDINKRAVLPGQTIATIKSNLESISGLDVFNELIPGINGTEKPLKCAEGVEKTKVIGGCEYKALWLGVVQSDSDTLTVKSGINVSDDNMKVTMSLLRPDIATDEGNILFSHVNWTLHEHGIVYGIKNDAIKLILENINEERKSKVDVLVAEGLPAKDGVDARIEFDKELSVGGKILPNGRVDYHEKSYPWNVKVNDVIGKVIPPHRSEDGRNVRGEELIANQVKESEPELEGIKKEADGALRVTEDGILLISGINLKVSDSLEIEGGVCQKTGNIHSDKTVNVKGYVEPGFILETKGDAIIQENVEDATVSADGSVVIKSGIRGTRSKIIAGGNITASFAENADLNAIGDILIANSIINCHTVCHGTMHVGDAHSRKSALVGDVTQAIKGVEVAILGSDSFNKTIIKVGAGSDSFMKLKELADEILNIKKGIADLNRLYEHCCKNPKSQKEQNAMLLKLTGTRDLKNKEYEELLEEKEKLKTLMEESKNAKVIVHKHVYPGVVIHMLNKAYEVKEERNAGVFLLKEEQIIFVPA